MTTEFFTAEHIADLAWNATESTPRLEDRYENMLAVAREELDNIHAEVIAACRRKVGL